MKSVLIVGASIAGCRAAAVLRDEGFEGQITLIGEERWPPYERPQLSKEWLNGGASPAFYLHEESFFSTNKIDLRLGARVDAIDLQAGGLGMADGTLIRGDRILLSTGGVARTLPLAHSNASNVFRLRNKDDAEKLVAALVPGARVVVVGMGVIGAEVAAGALARGCNVVGIETGPVPMQRTLGSRFGSWLAKRHLRAGLLLHTGTVVRRLIAAGDQVTAVELDNGAIIDADVLVVGIGIDPADILARGAGLALDDGIVVDRQCRTSNPMIFAAGDVTRQPGFFGGTARLETYQNAADQGAIAAAVIMGRDIEYNRCCWFWTDQYDLNIQVAGRIDETAKAVTRGDLDSQSFSTFFLRDDTVEGMIAVNRSADMAVGRRMIERRARVLADALGDGTVALRDVLAGSNPQVARP